MSELVKILRISGGKIDIAAADRLEAQDKRIEALEREKAELMKVMQALMECGVLSDHCGQSDDARRAKRQARALLDEHTRITYGTDGRPMLHEGESRYWDRNPIVNAAHQEGGEG